VDHPKRKKVSRISSERRGKNVENIEVMQLTNHVRHWQKYRSILISETRATKAYEQCGSAIG
jgi:hypothetical protein